MANESAKERAIAEFDELLRDLCTGMDDHDEPWEKCSKCQNIRKSGVKLWDAALDVAAQVAREQPTYYTETCKVAEASMQNRITSAILALKERE